MIKVRMTAFFFTLLPWMGEATFSLCALLGCNFLCRFNCFHCNWLDCCDDDNEETASVKPTDACVPQPCENGGTCVVIDDGHTCTCMDGFMGSNCESSCEVSQSSLYVTCTYDWECCSPLRCVNGLCKNLQCKDTGDEGCTSNVDCCDKDSVCDSNVCCVASNLVTCTYDWECCGDLKCMNGVCRPCYNNGSGRCTTQAECCDEKSICGPEKICCGNSNLVGCTYDWECCDGLFCMNGFCQPCYNNGEGICTDAQTQCCGANSDCVSGTCCLPLAEEGCENDYDCCDSRSMCDLDSKVCCLDAGGGCADKAECCGAHICMNGICCLPSGAGSCNDRSDCCGDQVCKNNVCQECTKTGQHGCESIEDCCNSEALEHISCLDGICCIDSQFGGCYDSEDCCEPIMHYCSEEEGTCMPCHKSGEECPMGIECCGGYSCSNGICCIPGGEQCSEGIEDCCGDFVCDDHFCFPHPI